MSLLLWSSVWNTGITNIDRQHRSLLNQINGLFDAIKSQDPSGLPDMLMFLAGYVDAHFRDEEIAMEATGFPGLAAHRVIHDDMRRQVAELISKFEGDRSVLTADVIEFLMDWLVNHIDGQDRAMADYLRRCDPSLQDLNPVSA